MAKIAVEDRMLLVNEGDLVNKEERKAPGKASLSVLELILNDVLEEKHRYQSLPRSFARTVSRGARLDDCDAWNI